MSSYQTAISVLMNTPASYRIIIFVISADHDADFIYMWTQTIARGRIGFLAALQTQTPQNPRKMRSVGAIICLMIGRYTSSGFFKSNFNLFHM